MHGLGDVEELIGAADDLPVGPEADVVHERDQRGEDLGDAAAERGGVDVQDARALEPIGEAQDLLRALIADDAAVGLDGLGRRGNGSEHYGAVLCNSFRI